jgi:hypothetical protein
VRWQFLLLIVTACGRWDFEPVCTGICECTTDQSCATHEYCDVEPGSRTCACVAGYADLGSGCTWVGVVADPAVRDPAVWTDPSSTIDPNAQVAGQIDVGVAHLIALDRITQTLIMPRRSSAEPLVVEVESVGMGSGDAPAAAVDDEWNELPPSHVMFEPRRACLAGSSYAPESSTGPGAARTLSVMPVQTAFAEDIDHVEIKPSMPEECPDPDTVPNGDAEHDGWWRFVVVLTTPDASTAAFQAGAGPGGTRAVRLYEQLACGDVEAAVPIAAPRTDHAALVFAQRATAGTQFTIDTLTRNYAFVGDGAAHITSVCVPAPLRGVAGHFQAKLDASGSCGAVVDRELVLDDVTFVDEPGCGGSPYVANPGFEAPSDLVNMYGLIASVVTDPGTAHSGSRAVVIGADQTCTTASLDVPLVVPAPNAGGGPAATFWYRATPAVNYQLQFFAGATAPAAGIQDGAWHRGMLCLDPHFAGRGQRLYFGMNQFSATSCSQAIPAETTVIDDLDVATDPACPGS